MNVVISAGRHTKLLYAGLEFQMYAQSSYLDQSMYRCMSNSVAHAYHISHKCYKMNEVEKEKSN